MLDFLATGCAHVAVPEATEQAMRFYQSGNILWTVQQAWVLILPLLFLIKHFSAKLETFSQKIGRNWFFTIVIYLILFVAIYRILNLPLSYYASYFRPHNFGLSTQALGEWFSNYAKTSALVMLGSVIFVWIFYLLLKKSPRRWWIYSSIVSIGILFIMELVQPIWIDPLFNEFGPMKNKQLEEQILHLASRAGIEGTRVFEVNKSTETSQLNAYVIGMGNSKRIVLWDTTIEKMTPDEILFVMGHEMGHYVLDHVWWHLLFFSILTFIIFYLTYKISTLLLNRYPNAFRFQLHSIASAPLLLFLICFFLLLSTPIFNYITRYMEHEADRFGLELTQNNQAAARAFIVLQKSNLSNPRPGNLFKFWRASHPPLGERIDFCNDYCPWKIDHKLKYSKYFDAKKDRSETN